MLLETFLAAARVFAVGRRLSAQPSLQVTKTACASPLITQRSRGEQRTTTMRSVSILALAVGAGAFAPSTLSRPSTALAVHRPRVAAPNTSNFKTSIAPGRAVAWLGYGRRTVPNCTPHTTAGNAAPIDT